MASSIIPAGPFELLKTAEGKTFPYYIIPFDKEGNCVGPKTRDHLLAASSGYSDIFFFSHGWNNDWTVATDRYKSFIEGYQQQRKALGLAVNDNYKPLLVGIFWPSQALAWLESETGPKFAAFSPTAAIADGAAAEGLVSDIAQGIPSERKARFYELAQSDGLSQDEAQELTQMLAGLNAPDDEGSALAPPNASDLLKAAQSYQAADPSEEPDYDETGATTAADVQNLTAAGGLGKLDPRNILKPFTVWQMKDRAGVVGSRGVSSLLADLLAKSQARIHLLGHSYGCKVVMNALSAIPENKMVRQVHSATLLQAAFSQYAFATQLPDDATKQGGFHKSLARVKGPILATFSANDVALSQQFHLALRRKSDIGELQAAAAGEPVSKYGALGGFGPQPSLAPPQLILDPGVAYQFGAGGRVLGIQATRKISGHGDISNPATWWLAYNAAIASY